MGNDPCPICGYSIEYACECDRYGAPCDRCNEFDPFCCCAQGPRHDPGGRWRPPCRACGKYERWCECDTYGGDARQYP